MSSTLQFFTLRMCKFIEIGTQRRELNIVMDKLETDNINHPESGQGTHQEEARDLLKTVCTNLYERDVKKAALALGREEDTLQKMLDGEETIDEDLVMKMNGLVEHRGGG